jgi:hypothetical protein
MLLTGDHMKGVVVAMLVGFALPVAIAAAAGPFDGTYSGGSPAVSRTCPTTNGTVSVVDGKVNGKFAESRYTFSLTGTVAPDGTMTGKWAGSYPVTGKFTAGHFEGTYASKECGTERRISLDKSG